METESEQNSNSTSGSSSSGGSTRPQISQMSLYERQAVQALQALQRQPNAAQYFHQFMLQQQFNSAQLHSLAAVQQATIAASRQASSPNTSTSQQTTTTQASPQLGNLLQVNRTLGRNVPLASQLILMPNGAVAAVQQEVPPTQSPGVHADTDQVQNLAVRSQQTSATNAQLQGSAQKTALPGSSQASGLPQAASTGQSMAVAQASSSGAGQSLNLSQAAAGSNGVSGGVVATGGSQPSMALSQSSSAGAAGSCQRKGTGVVQPLPVAAAQAVTVSQGSQTETENAAAKKGDTDTGGQQTVGMNLTRTATPAPSQTLISSATYTQIQPHSLIQQQQQIHLQKQVVIQQQIAIHQQQFQHRQSQLLHTATHLQLAQQQQQQQAASLTQQQQQAQPPQHRTVRASQPPQGKSQTLAVKRKAESEEEKEEPASVTTLVPARSSPVTDNPKNMEEKSGLGDNSDPAATATPNATSSEGVSATPSSASTPNLALVSRQMGDSKPPQAIVKPQILTHIIEGFVIQEGAEPFPVGCSQLLKDSEKPLQGEAPSGQNENLSSNSLGEDSASMELDKKANLLKCEYCGKYAPASQFRGSKRFCSMTCAKRYNVSCSHQFRLQRKKMKEFQEANYARVRRRGPRRSSSEIARTKIQGKRHRGQEDSSRGSDNSSYDEALSPTSPGPLSVRASHGERDLANSNMAPPTPDLHGINPVFLSSNPSRWSVEEVYEFIASLQGCQEIAEEFRSQEIDGQALLLLKEEHLMSAMNIKLGPALKICAKINVLKET
ncbi:polyhomeotic-like protein 1 isoform X12 [Ammospiza caudacuta]|uniref:polyhomeotic-like protein 1 isoform X12 n=1 Tax=Ammospiza caudacuta TaxID=2857398 RepID=UPI002738B608|nr:polyhomeotic-like protein 1 isoform X12 [Ammospiza caudacuta]